MTVSLVLVVKDNEEYIVIDTQDLGSKQFGEAYGDLPTERIILSDEARGDDQQIEDELTSWPTDRKLVKP